MAADGRTPQGPYTVARSAFIATPGEARGYYQARFAGMSPHGLMCRGRPLSVVFEPAATHLFSKEAGPGGIRDGFEVRTVLGGGKIEVREYCPIRAAAMDAVFSAICKPALSHRAHASMKGSENWLLYGFPERPSRLRMLVVLRPGSKGAWVCISAYQVDEKRFEAVRRFNERFPP
jgi:hypothetical protein